MDEQKTAPQEQDGKYKKRKGITEMRKLKKREREEEGEEV